VAIRDRKSGQWQADHSALYQDVSGSILFRENGSLRVTPGLPRVGESMYFDTGNCDLVTSSIVSVERPLLDTVGKYVQ
jgi:hypothetical protein